MALTSEMSGDTVTVNKSSAVPNRARRVTELHNSLAMNGGQGPYCYAHNSGNQGRAVSFIYPVLREAIHRMGLPTQMPLTVADFGCSSGPNCIDHMDTIAACFREKADESSSPLEIQYFFSDLPSNDFNNLFRMLAEKAGAGNLATPLVAAIPGSFAKRLLPSRSLNLGFSTFTLHWITKIPEEVLTRTSAAWNEGRVFVHGGKPEVLQAYSEQARADLRDFLRCRAEELVPGGRLFLFFLGRPGDDPSYQLNECSMLGLAFVSVEAAWAQLIAEGVLDDEEGSSVNIPMFMRSEREVREVVEEFIEEFHVERLQIIEQVPILEESVGIAEKVVRSFRPVVETLLENHIGQPKTELLFQRVVANLKKLPKEKKIDINKCLDTILVVLERK